MDDSDPTSIPSFAHVIPAIAKSVYSDAVSGVLKEAGKVGVDLMKTLRLALFPMQYTAALQDRLSNYLHKAISAVPEPRRIVPRESLVLSISERLRLHDEFDPLSKLYVNLLSRALDSERLGEAHPAFVNIIGQLAPDEAMLIDLLGRTHNVSNSRLSPKGYLVFRGKSKPGSFLTRPEVVKLVRRAGTSFSVSTFQLEEAALPIEQLAQPELFSTFLEHLTALGLVAFDNEARDATSKIVAASHTSFEQLDLDHFTLRLNEFGTLFFRACVKNEPSS